MAELTEIPGAAVTVGALYRALDAQIPRSLSCSWDNDGLSCCPDPEAPLTGILVALDATEDALAEAVERHCNVILTHHPMLFRGLKAVDGFDTSSRKVIRMIQSGVAAMAFHTRLDTVDGGVNDVLAGLLGLTDISSFGENGNAEGKCMGRIGSLPAPLSADAFIAQVKEILHVPAVLFAGCGKPVSRVAVLGGAGSSEISAAIAAGADTYLTGELGYHQLCDAPYQGINLLAAGHYHTEFPVCARLAALAREIAPACPIFIRGSARVEVR